MCVGHIDLFLIWFLPFTICCFPLLWMFRYEGAWGSNSCLIGPDLFHSGWFCLFIPIHQYVLILKVETCVSSFCMCCLHPSLLDLAWIVYFLIDSKVTLTWITRYWIKRKSLLLVQMKQTCFSYNLSFIPYKDNPMISKHFCPVISMLIVLKTEIKFCKFVKRGCSWVFQFRICRSLKLITKHIYIH